MTPLVDADVLLHEIGWSCEFKDKDSGEEILFDFDRAAEFLDKKIDIICEDVGATTPPILFVTANEFFVKEINRARKRNDEPLLEYKEGFRYSVAKTKPYKGNRVNPKPFHFNNLFVYMNVKYDLRVVCDGLEADDAIVKYQYENENTVICSRDKDLRICPGWHYSWECGEQAAIELTQTDELGWLDFEREKFIGYGLAFFYYQMLAGDPADCIPGVEKIGHVKACKILKECKTKQDFHNTVKNVYKEVYGERAKEMFFEQATLLWLKMKEDFPWENKK